MNVSESAAAGLHAAPRASVRDGWLSLLVMALVIGSALFSFGPRSKPQFEETRVYPERLLATGVAQQGSRFVGVGEQGQILIADAVQGPWRSAKVEPQRGSTFTKVAFVADKTVVAVGHDSWIVRSADAGETWAEVGFAEEGSEPLLGVAGPLDGRLFAFGAFGLFYISDDLGQTWARRDLVIEADAESAAESDAESDPYADPFAAFQEQEFSGDRHINGIAQASDGTLIAVGERGLLLRSTNKGDSWSAMPEIYAGSLFGVMALPSKTLVTYGMRGHVYRSTDAGSSWTEIRLPTGASLFAGAVDGRGRVLLAGAGSAILQSDDDGVSFKRVSAPSRNAIADLIPLADGGWLTAGEGGVRVKQPAKAAAPAGDAS